MMTHSVNFSFKIFAIYKTEVFVESASWCKLLSAYQFKDYLHIPALTSTRTKMIVHYPIIYIYIYSWPNIFPCFLSLDKLYPFGIFRKLKVKIEMKRGKKMKVIIIYPAKITFHRWAVTTSKDEHEKLPLLSPNIFPFSFSIIAPVRWKVFRT